MLTKTIDSLFIAMRYGIWGLGVLGLIVSVILAFINAMLGMNSVFVFVATFFLVITISLVFLPKGLVRNNLWEKRFIIAIVTSVLAVMIMAIIYYLCGGFPELDLLFI